LSKDEVRAKVNLSELVAEYVHLQPAGAGRFRGLCPFHKEKSPSFHVDSARGYYYCFGCKAGGDAFNFLMNLEHVSFADALERLAVRVGVTLERRSSSEKSHRDLYEINEMALGYFKEHLAGTAQEYLHSRGLNQSSLERFELGYSPASYDGLIRYAKVRGVVEAQLLSAGLLSENDEGRSYDRFRGRVMFPIRDVLGRLVGYGGRVLDDSKPKYLNTPETEIFKKSEQLYGFNLARRAASSGQELLVVEGYLDVIALQQAGFETPVATLGTALTADHATLLARQGVSRLALLFDHDAAGQRATLSALDQTVGSRFAVRALMLPNGKDPAEVLAAGDLEALKKALLGGIDEVELRLEYAFKQYDIRTVTGKRDLLMFLLPRMQAGGMDLLDASEPIAAKMRRRVAERLEIDEKKLSEWVVSKSKFKNLSSTQVMGMLEGRGGEEVRERQLAHFLLQDPDLLSKLEGGTAFRSRLVQQIISVIRETGSREAVFDHFRGQPEEKEVLELMFGLERPEMMTGEQAAWQKAQETRQQQVEVIESRRSEDELRGELIGLKQLLPTATPELQSQLLQQIGDLQKAVEAERRSRMTRGRA
jgi:DNA primase